MVVRPARSSWSERPPSPSLRQTVQALAILALAVLTVLVLVRLSPFALRERPSSGPVADTAAALPGQAQQATDGLRRLGYSCSDAVTSADTVARSCSRVRYVATAQVQMLLERQTGLLQLAQTTIDEDKSEARTTHQEVLDVLARALDLPPGEQARLNGAAAGNDETSLALDWGSAVVRPGETSGSTLRMAGSSGLGLASSSATLRVPVDVLAAAAQAHGYTCTTPEVRTIRSCARSDGDYADDLWLQGDDTNTSSVSLDVTSTHRTRTRSHWVRTMAETLSWVDTSQTRHLRSWLAASADAPGAQGYVDGLPVSFLVRRGGYTKETFGGIKAECAPTADDISACEALPATADQPG